MLVINKLLDPDGESEVTRDKEGSPEIKGKVLKRLPF